MSTQILSIEYRSKFGRIDNPLWQVGAVDSIAEIGKRQTYNVWNPILIPLESSPALISQFSKNQRSIFQTFISEESLQNRIFFELLEQNKIVQIWVDRVVTTQESIVLSKLLAKYENLDLVYLPDLHLHPDEVFKNLVSVPRLLIHLKTKESAFDRWLSHFEIWDRYCWIKKYKNIKNIGFQIFENQIQKIDSQAEINFLVSPCYENLIHYLNHAQRADYFLQKCIRIISHLFGIKFLDFSEQVLWVLAVPSKSSFRSVTFLLFYPVRKIYWILEHAIRTRILGKSNESR